MALKTILVCLMNRQTAEAALRCAVPLARAQGAHLIGLHVIEAILVYPGIAMHIPDAVFGEFNQRQADEARAIREIFERHTDGEPIQSEWRLLQAETTSAADRMIESAHTADLVILSKEDPSVSRGDGDNAQARVIQRSGRPVVVVPSDYNGGAIGSRAVLGWSNTREAARAAHDLVALAAPEAEIDILRVDGGKLDEMSDHVSIELAETLDRHGLAATVVHRDRAGQDIATVLLHHAFETGADLLAVGAFGHSRAYDFVIGAVTHGLLRKADVPVLFSA